MEQQTSRRIRRIALAVIMVLIVGMVGAVLWYESGSEESGGKEIYAFNEGWIVSSHGDYGQAVSQTGQGETEVDSVSGATKSGSMLQKYWQGNETDDGTSDQTSTGSSPEAGMTQTEDETESAEPTLETGKAQMDGETGSETTGATQQTDGETESDLTGAAQTDQAAAGSMENGSGKYTEKRNPVQIRDEDYSDSDEEMMVTLPYYGVSEPNEIIVYDNILPQEYAGKTMTFYSNNAMVRVIIGSRVIYRYGVNEKRLFGSMPDSNQNFVDLPTTVKEGTKIRIELVSDLRNASATLSTIRVADKDVAIVEQLASNLSKLVGCILLLMTAMVAIVIGFLRVYSRQESRGEIFLGIFSILACIYYFIGTRTLGVFLGNQSIYTLFSYICFMLLPYFLSLYWELLLGKRFPRRFFLLVWIATANVLVQLMLQILGREELGEMVFYSAFVMLLLCVISMLTVTQSAKRKVLPASRAFFVLVQIFYMAIGQFHDAYSYWRGNSQENAVGLYATAVFSVSLTVYHIVMLTKDYSEAAKRNAEQLKEQLDKIEEQNRLLIQAKEEAETARHEAIAANEAKSRFLANMSHEIRTPINAVIGMDEMILRESGEAAVRDYAMDIYTAAQTLLSLINDILDFSKIESGKMEIVPVDYDVSSMIHDLVNMISSRARDKGLTLKVEVDSRIPSRLFGDDVRVRQVLTNILTNAVKYTHEGTVWLRIQSRLDGEDAVLHFEVEDTGIGIRQEDLPKLYVEFERIEENRNRNIEGTGLGMSITIRLLSLMGSKLEVDSVYGEGSKFYFDLRQKITNEVPIGDLESRVQDLAKNYTYTTAHCAPQAQILVVDDNAMNRRVFCNLLKQTQIQITEADGGARCLELASQHHYDLIFLDHMMPQMDGVETLHRMRELGDYPCRETPVIVLTANAVAGAREEYLKEGFDDFLSKPIDAEKLEKMIWEKLPKELIQEREVDAAEHETDSGAKEFQAQLEELPPVDGLDWSYAGMHLPELSLIEYSVRDFYQLLDTAADKLEEYQKQIYEEGQLELYRIQVHSMKSSAATIGIVPLAGMAKVLEFAARDGKIDVILAMSPVFLDEWRSYKLKLEGVFGLTSEKKGGGEEITDMSVVVALLAMLRISMDEMDIDAADDTMEQLRRYSYPGNAQELVDALGIAVANLDGEQTGQLVDELTQLLGGVQLLG